MSDIELVIKIPEELYNNIQKGCGIYPYKLVYEAMRNGTPLPKGHGKLIDADALEFEIASIEGYSELDYECVAREDIEQAETIIEADRRS